ncbi:MAG: MBL fold metallo-hydrolase [Alphaproteobacteria bacterium]|nr:MBL fold metallo-hydrolase [Alphaproteobacteria bacterium]
MRRGIWIALGVVAVLIVAGYVTLHSPAVDVWIYKRVANARMDKPIPTLAAPDELSALLCGTGSPMPNPDRAANCTLIAAGDKYYVVDAGQGSDKNFLTWRIDLSKVAGVFITHFHSDHIAELGELRLQTWVAGRKEPLKVYGPPGIEDVVNGFNLAYKHDAEHRVAHHGAKFLPPDAVPLVAVVVPLHDGKAATAFDQDGLRVTAIKVKHDPVVPAYGYRFDFKGHSIVVSGDTAPSENLMLASKGADVLIHEAQSAELVNVLHDALAAHGQSRTAQITHDILTYHTDPKDAAKIANEAHVKLLVFSHVIPVLGFSIAERAFMRGVSDVRPDGVKLGHDGMVITVKADGTIDTSDVN